MKYSTERMSKRPNIIRGNATYSFIADNAVTYFNHFTWLYLLA